MKENNENNENMQSFEDKEKAGEEQIKNMFKNILADDDLNDSLSHKIDKDILDIFNKDEPIIENNIPKDDSKFPLPNQFLLANSLPQPNPPLLNQMFGIPPKSSQPQNQSQDLAANNRRKEFIMVE
jgi:hypothetical protein